MPQVPKAPFKQPSLRKKLTNNSSLTNNLCLDIGSATTKIIWGNRLVFDQPTCITRHLKTLAVVSIGKNSSDSKNKVSGNFQTVFPIQNGEVVDREALAQFLQKALNQSVFSKTHQLLSFLNLSKAFVAVQDSISAVQTQVITKALREAGVSRVKLIESSTALYRLVKKQVPIIDGCITINIGSQTCQVGVFSENFSFSKSLKIGGNFFIETIIDQIRSKHHLEVSWQTAEKILSQLEDVFGVSKDQPRSKKIVVRGRNVINNLVESHNIDTSLFQDRLLEACSEIVGEISDVFGLVPASEISQALENGIFLTGGGSQLFGFADYISAQLKSEIIPLGDPTLSVVRGLCV